MAVIELRTFGGIDLTGSGSHDLEVVLRQPKRIALLAYLAIAGHDVFVRRDKLLALLWPELDTDHARGSLRTALHRLRQALGDGLIESRGADELRLDHRIVWCDARALHDAVAAQDHRAVLELYRGELLDGFFVSGCAPEFEQWLDDERRRFRDLASRAAWALAAAAEAKGDGAEAAHLAQRAVDIAQSDEEGLRRLLDLLLRTGNRAAAIAAYERFTRRLDLHLQVEPSAETRSLIDRARIRADEPRTRTTTSPPSALPAIPLVEVSPLPAPRSRRRATMLAGVSLLALLGAGYAGMRGRGALWGASTHDRAQRWEQWTIDGLSPIARSHAVAVLDSTGRAILLYGGSNGAKVSDMWRLSNVDSSAPLRWTKLIVDGEPGVGPVARSMAAAVYNARTDRMILFGGSVGWTSPCTDELWILKNVSGGAPQARLSWEKIPRAGAWPSARADHRMVYDAASNRAILFGGHDCIAPVFSDVWVLHDADGTAGTPTWELLHPDTSEGQPRGPRGEGLAYNPSSNRLISFGGYDHFGKRFFDDVWVLTNANGIGGRPAWHRVNVVGVRPAPRINGVAQFDAATNRLIIVGGANVSGSLNDAWVLVGADGTTLNSTWTSLGPFTSAPTPFQAAASVFDRRTDRLVLLGGFAQEAVPLDRLWLLSNATGR